MHIDPILRQTFNQASPISCNKSPQNVIALDLDTDEHFLLTPKPVLRATPMVFEPKQVQSALSTNTFTALKIVIHCEAELTKFLNRVLIT